VATNGKLLTLEEVAEFLRVKPPTIRRWVREKRFPEPLRVGLKLLWKPASIERVLEDSVSSKPNWQK